MKTNAFLFLIICLVVSSCGPKWHLKQSARHERIAIQKGAVIQSDTVWLDRPVYVKEIVQDTVLLTTEGDTIYIERDRLKIKFVDLPGDSVFIEGKCEADTIFQKVPVTIEKVIYAPEKGLKTWQWIIIALAAGLIVGIIIKR